MEILFESRQTEGMSMRNLSVNRVRFVLRRLSSNVHHAKVRLSDINGPRGGIDKCCQLEIKTNNLGTVVIASQARDWRTALNQCLARISRVLTRNLQRQHKQVRTHSTKLVFDQ
ncbi:MAG: HPF/RaiA family ribosome-associated protein [Betaproteobacteria bacterium]|nr:HPF/RaiA family ribosome-associated protein [Betaproteobacteria bacterium]